MQQWLQEKDLLGWNPYLGGGQPFALLNNVAYQPWSYLLTGFYRSVGLTFSNMQEFNLSWIFQYLFFSTGCLLLFFELFKSHVVSLWGYFSLIISNLVVIDLYEPIGYILLYTMPWLLFFAIRFYKTNNWSHLYLFSMVCGYAMNIYIPVYVIVSVLCLGISTLLFYPEMFLTGIKRFRETSNILRKLGICFIIFLVFASPMLCSFFEMQDVISPSRGFTQNGSVSSQNSGLQTSLSISMDALRYLTEFTPVTSFYDYTHTVFYVGVINIALLFLIPLGSSKGKAFILATFLIFLLSLGTQYPLWNWLIDHVPFFNMLRHAFLFSRMLAFFILLASLHGLNVLLGDSISRIKVMFFLLIGLCIVTKIPIMIPQYLIETGILLFICLCIILYYQHQNYNRKQGHTYVLLLLCFIQLFLFSPLEKRNGVPSILGQYQHDDWDLLPFSPMNEWFLYPRTLAHKFPPFDLSPTINKRVSWSDPQKGYLMWIQPQFYRMTQILEKDYPQTQKGKIYHLYPQNILLNEQEIIQMINGKSDKKSFLETEETIQILPEKNPNRALLQINMEQPGTLVRMVNYHKGWHAYIDNSEVTLTQSAFNFQQISVPAGNHVVSFEFSSIYPWLFYLQLLLLPAGWVTMLFFLNKEKMSLAEG
ncbi:MAG: hypothetical protein HQM11_12105 [SAR324 cluster bacterium]|nr:hypothetical protein [SAR324 cluster bacterium]